MFQGIWRQRLMDGSYSIKAAGIFQTDPGYFANRDGPNSPTANVFRGAIQTAGQFSLSDKWVWGWTGLLMTDTQFLFDYQSRPIPRIVRSVPHRRRQRRRFAALPDRRG